MKTKKVDILPAVDLQPAEEALATLYNSPAVIKIRVPTYGDFSVRATGEKLAGHGAALILIVNEKMLKQGWG